MKRGRSEAKLLDTAKFAYKNIHDNHDYYEREIWKMLTLLEGSLVGQRVRSGLVELQTHFCRPNQETNPHRPSEKSIIELERMKKCFPEKSITFWCRSCSNWMTVKEDVNWLECKCECMCKCHYDSRWDKSKCVCKPCKVCGTGSDKKSINGPFGSCGKQRLCHFGQNCRYKNSSCGFKHE